jgi:hypothetical protein
VNENESVQALSRAVDAEHILTHPMVVEALTALRADVYEKIEATGWKDKDAREALYHQLKAIANFEARFVFFIEEGRDARSMLDKMRADKRAKARR